jgi:predicted nucleotidyltransferase
MILHHVLGEVFRSRSHVAVLRALLDTDIGFTGNHVARLTGMHPLTALKVLSSLEELGIVRRQRGGRDHIFTLNRNHFLVEHAVLPIFEAEKQLPGVVQTALSACLTGHVRCAVIFGSVARAEENARSDLDVCCIVKNKQEQEEVREKLQREASSLAVRFGVNLAPLIFTISEFRSQSKTQAVKEILRDAKLIAGKMPEIFLHG